MHCRGRQLGQEVLKDTAVYTHRVSKNAPSLASCSFYKHGLILIFFLVNSISTFSKMT